jgi:hypothetical protein
MLPVRRSWGLALAVGVVVAAALSGACASAPSVLSDQDLASVEGHAQLAGPVCNPQACFAFEWCHPYQPNPEEDPEWCEAVIPTARGRCGLPFMYPDPECTEVVGALGALKPEGEVFWNEQEQKWDCHGTGQEGCPESPGLMACDNPSCSKAIEI